MKYFQLLTFVLFSFSRVFSQQTAVPKEDLILKQISLKYLELSTTQLNTIKKSPCDFVYTTDIKQSILSAIDAASKITDANTKNGVIAVIKSNLIIKPLLTSEFSLRLAFENLKSGRSISDFSNEQTLRIAFKNSTFWGPAPGAYGHVSFYVFKDNTVEYNYRDGDPAEDTKWGKELKSFKILKTNDDLIVIAISNKKYYLMREEGNNQSFFYLSPFDKESDDAFFETAGECEA
jgi:hypothetical protein